MSEKAKIALVFGAVAAVVGGGAFYFFKIHQPAQRLADARSEIATWEEERWTRARACLLGEKPASAKISESLAIRELSPDPWERGSCTKLISQLNRGEGTNTGIPRIEQAWVDLDKAAGKVAMSFIKHVDPEGEPAAGKHKVDPMPDALDALQAAHAALREAAELPPPAVPETAAPLAEATMITIKHDDQPVVMLSQQRVTSRAGLLSFATGASGELQIQFVTGREPTLAPVEAGTLRAVPDHNWGARGVPDAIEIGAIDAGGEPVEPTRLPLPGAVEVIAAVGTMADGVVVFGAGDKLVIARGKNGTFTAGKPIDISRVAFATDAASGHTLIVWADAKQGLHALTLAPGQLDATPEDLRRTGTPTKLCLDRDSAWLQFTHELGTTLVDYQPGQVREVDAGDHWLTSCTVDGAWLQESTYGSPISYRHCMQDCNPFTLPTARAPVVVLSHGWASFHARGGVLQAKRTTRSDYYAVPNGFRPLVALTDGKHIDVVGYTSETLAIARVPAN